ncbi:hypothetical protein NliqN6_5242 [Naganishia liquefaciens]|uniref:F-box domain-containing protein n=1 Tax=Naganishia liquefaciens TaxID=104408 RepID=A0A8H3YGG7_9TREE|nr:hypothetical protein NliqN6_5242 [Naganishia liquefaciens]
MELRDSEDITQLPLDLYLPILEHIPDKSVLAKLCLVDRLFLELAREKLYEFVWVRPWEPGADPKFRLLFRTLNENAEVAELVRKIDVRYYPLAAGIIQWEDICAGALKNMKNLESVTWTRNRTLRSSMLDALATLPRLSKLEINGNSKWSYDPVLLNNLDRLQELRIVLPDRRVAENLKELVKLRAAATKTATTNSGNVTQPGGLRVLELISQDSRWIDDGLLHDLAPYLGGLEVFKLWGCAHVGPRGYFEVIRSAQGTLRELALEGVGPGDDHDLLDEDLYLERESPLTLDVRLPRLAHLSASEQTFHRLTLADKSRQEQADVFAAIRGAFPPRGPRGPGDTSEGLDWSTVRRNGVYPHLGEHSFLPPTLSAIQISGNKDGPVMPGDTASHLVAAAAEMDLATIAERLPGLDTLMLRMSDSRKEPKWIASHLARMHDLRVFHLQTSERRPEEEVYTMADLELLAQGCGEKLEQIGWANRVYHVRRRRVLGDREEGTQFLRQGWRHESEEWQKRADLAERDEVYLEPWQAGTGSIPEIFQVWRA